MIHSPIGTISPLSSASGMKTPGGIGAALRMMPADQRLEADDLAVDARLRLVDQCQFVAFDRASQLLLHRALLAQPLVHAGFEEAERAAAFGLGAVERSVGVADQRRRVAAVGGKYGDADAEPEADRMAVDDRYPRLTAASRRSASASAAPGCSPSVAITTNSSPPSRATKAPAGGGLQPHRHLAEHLVAGGMAVNVIDLLEAVEVEAEQRKGLVVPCGGLDRGVDACGERGPVRQAGEQVMMDQPRDLRFCALAMGAVVHHGEEILRLALRIADRQAGRRGDAAVAAGGG